MSKRFEGKNAIITGGSRGIGLGVAAQLAKEGANIILWDSAPSQFDPTSVQFKPISLLKVDVTDADAVNAAAQQSIRLLGKVDVLINNAGINGPVVETTSYPLEQWDRVLAVNLTGVFYCCRAIVPSMREHGYGRIVNVSSIGGKEGVPGICAYTASKAGVIGFTKTLARELATSGILVNCVAPAMVETELMQQMTEAHIAASRAKIPMGRFLAIEELAKLIAYAASEDNSFTTGFTFDATGGRADY